MKHCEILIIDDDLEDIEILMEALNNRGVEHVHYVYSAIEAFQYLKDVYPDCIPRVIVTDVLLPAVTGAQFLEQLRTMDEYNNVKVVVLTSANSEHQKQKFGRIGTVDFYVKPLDFAGYNKLAGKIKCKMDD